jgi:DNA-binding response OmpR family regulator
MDERAPVVLVADDDPEIRTLITIQLARAGYSVLEAADGQQALDQVREHTPDLVILDVMMPTKNGWEVAKELRRDTRLKNVGIIMLTAIGERINELTSPLYGADEFMDKPFEFDALQAKIISVLDRRGSST